MTTISCTADPQTTVTDDEFSHCTTSTYSGLHITLWPYDDEIGAISPRDIAKHLSKVIYYPESAHSPFSAAQYAVELANSLKNVAPHVKLYALLRNVHEAYLGHVSPPVRAAEKLIASQRYVEDGRDALESAFTARIFRALNLLTLQAAHKRNLITIENLAAIENAKQRLDSTLERDLGIYIHRQNNTKCTAFPRFIVPLRWDRASDHYLRSYQRLILASRQTISADTDLYVD